MKRIKCIFALLHYSMADAPFNLERFFPVFSLLVEGVFCAFAKITSSDLLRTAICPPSKGSFFSCGVSRGSSQKIPAVASLTGPKAQIPGCTVENVL